MADKARKILLVSSHGGHLTELLELAPAFEGYDPVYFCYDAETSRRLHHRYLVPNKPYSPIAFVRNLWRVFRIVGREKPVAVISTGAEIAIPAFLVAKLKRLPTIYVECGAQVTTPSITGRILSRVSDRFFVQWPELLQAYGNRVEYVGSLVDETLPERS